MTARSDRASSVMCSVWDAPVRGRPAHGREARRVVEHVARRLLDTTTGQEI
jgi:hypothetical protein